MQTYHHSTRCAAIAAICLVPAALGAPRIVDLDYVYHVASTLDHQFSPALHPDMDGDGNSDLEGQANLGTLIDILGDETHPQHGELLATFVFNETLAGAAWEARFPHQPIVPYMAELAAVFMTIRGAGAFQGPTQTGMAGRMEALWTQYNIAGSAGSFDSQSWQQSSIFGGASSYTASIVATGGGTVTCGQRVVIAASPSNALNYAWFKDNAPLDSPPEPSLVFDSVTLEDSGEYFCELELPGKSTVQTPALALTVKEAPSLPAPSALATVLAIGIISLCGVALRASGSQRSIRA